MNECWYLTSVQSFGINSPTSSNTIYCKQYRSVLNQTDWIEVIGDRWHTSKLQFSLKNIYYHKYYNYTITNV